MSRWDRLAVANNVAIGPNLTRFHEMVTAAQRLVEREPSLASDEYKGHLAELVLEATRWSGQKPTVQSLSKYIFGGDLYRFYLDPMPGVYLVAEDSGETWNGWAVPTPTAEQVTDYMIAVADFLFRTEQEDELAEHFAAFMRAYGGDHFDRASSATLADAGFVWVKADKVLP